MSPSLQTMGFFMSDINFCNTKEQLNHLGEVVTGKVDGSPTGADIGTSTLPYTGQVRKTLPALEGEYEQSIADKEAEADAAIDSYRLLNKGPYASGIALDSKFEFITYNGESYFATNPPYTTTSTTPDADVNLFVGGYVNESLATQIAENVLEENISTYTDIVYKSSGGNSAVENMLEDLNLNPLMYAVGTIIKTGGTTWDYEDSTGPVTLENFRAFNMLYAPDFGVKGDYYLPDGSLNPNPTDDTSAWQRAVDATGGNGGIFVVGMSLTSDTIKNKGVLTLKTQYGMGVWVASSHPRSRQSGIVNNTTDFFESDVGATQTSYTFDGMTFIGNATTTSSNDGTNSLVSTTGRTYEVDYYNLNVNGCLLQKFGTCLDGTLGSWSWKVKNSEIGAKLGADLEQPHSAVFDTVGFSNRNEQDLRVNLGQSFKLLNCAMDFNIRYKKIGIEIKKPQGFLIQGAYAEELSSGTGSIVNGGEGTYPIIIEAGQFVQGANSAIKNNYYAAPSIQKLITIKRESAFEDNITTLGLSIYENTVSGLAGDYLYHDWNGSAGPGLGLLIMKKPVMLNADTSETFTIGDPSGKLVFTNGDFYGRSDLTNPANNTVLFASSDSNSQIIYNERAIDISTSGNMFRPSTACKTTFKVNFHFSDSVSKTVTIRIQDLSGAGVFGEYRISDAGDSGSGSISIPIERGATPSFRVSLIGDATVCENLFVTTEWATEEDYSAIGFS